MSVAVGFSAYLQDLFDNLFGFHLPPSIAYPAVPGAGRSGGVFNIPALLITMLVTWVLVRGVRESAGANTTMVMIKIAAILHFLPGRGEGDQPAQLASFRAARISGHPDRRVHRLLHLHRLRFDLDGRGGVPARRSAICRSASSRR